MEQLLNFKDFTYSMNLRTSCKIKVFDVHTRLPWVCYSTQNNIIQIWDYNRKVCIKSFSEVLLETGEIIDIQKNFELRTLKFYDKDTIFWMFPNSNSISEEEEKQIKLFQKNWLIIQGEQKIIFIDYINEEAYCLNQQDLDSKNIKCLEVLDHQYIALGCSDGQIKIFDTNTWSIPKTMRGPAKSINFMKAHKQNEGNRPRLIVSSTDGSLSCWNVDTNNDSPAFRFQMMKKGKQILSANDNQDIIAISLDSIQHRLVTVTEDYVTVWSSLAGTELTRFKNLKGSSVRDINKLSHPDFSQNLFIVHTRESELFLVNIEQKSTQFDSHTKLPILDFIPFFDLKHNQQLDRRIQILTFKMHPLNPSLFFFGTIFGFYHVILNKNHQVNIAFNNLFTSKLKLEQTNEFVFTNGNHKQFSNQESQKLKQYEEQQQTTVQNLMFLSITNQTLQCNMFDPTKTNSSIIAKSNLQDIKDYHFNWDESQIKTSISGKFISVLHKQQGIYKIFKIDNSLIIDDKDKLLNLGNEESKEDSLHFLSKLKLIHQGTTINLVWHQYRDEFATLSPMDKNNGFIGLTEKSETFSTGSFFSKKSYTKYVHSLSATVSKISLCVYSLEQNDSQPQLLMFNDKFLNPTKLYGEGEIYCVVDLAMEQDINDMLKNPSSRQKEAFRMHKFNKAEFFDVERSTNKYIKIGNPIIEPTNIYYSDSSKLIVVCYSQFSNILKYDYKTQKLQHFKQINKQVNQGYFWEEIFFFVNDQSVYMIVSDLKEEIIEIEIASYQLNLKKSEIFDFGEIFQEGQLNQYDDIYPEVQKRPPGQLKIVTLYNNQMILINHNKEIFYLDLNHPFIKFCMYFQHEKYDSCIEQIKMFNPITHYIFAQMFIYKEQYQLCLQNTELQLIDQLLIELIYLKSININTLKLIFQQSNYSFTQKKYTLNYVLYNLSQNQEKQQQNINIILKLAIQYNLINKNNNSQFVLQNDDEAQAFQKLQFAKQSINNIIPQIFQEFPIENKDIINTLTPTPTPTPPHNPNPNPVPQPALRASAGDYIWAPRAQPKIGPNGTPTPTRTSCISIYTQATKEEWIEYPPDKYQFIAASYVKYIESAGARVIPIKWDSDLQTLEYQFNQINGILFPGGSTFLNDDKQENLFTENAKFILNLAMKSNQNGNYFPVWGTCLGFELMGYIMSNDIYFNVLSEVGNDNNTTHTVLIQNQYTNHNQMMNIMSEQQKLDLEQKNTVYYYHHEGILPQTIKNIPNLSQNFTITGLSTSETGTIFTASYEGKIYPFYGTQFHPEKNLFEWKVNANHSLYAIQISQKWANFFVEKCRNNLNSFQSQDYLNEVIIYNFPMVQIKDSSFNQCYIIPN